MKVIRETGLKRGKKTRVIPDYYGHSTENRCNELLNKIDENINYIWMSRIP